MRRPFIVFAICLFITVTVHAGDKHAPLPERLLQAKTLYLDNQSGEASLADRAYDELTKWGRYKVVQDRKYADIILLLSAREYHGGYVTTGNIYANQNNYGSGTTTTGTVTTRTQEITSGTTYITFIDASGGDSLWADAREWGRFRSATRGIIKDLRKRVEEQEKH